MGRPERPLDPTAGPVQALAADLRRLREAAGRPKYTTLAQRTGRSQTALSEAAGGQRLPSWETVEAFVRGCGGDPAAWRTRWELARAVTDADRHGPDAASLTAQSVPRPRRRRRVIVTALVAAVLVAGGAVTAWLMKPSRPSSQVQFVNVVDGADPMDSHCSDDPAVTTLDSLEVTLRQQPVGRVELRYSPACGTSWARFSPFSETALPRGTVVHTDVIRAGDGRREPFQAGFVGAQVFGNMLHSTETCVRASVRIGDAQSAEVRTECYRGRVLVK